MWKEIEMTLCQAHMREIEQLEKENVGSHSNRRWFGLNPCVNSEFVSAFC